jgi:hypothetical protein
MNFLSKGSGGHLSRGFPRGTAAIFLLSTPPSRLVEATWEDPTSNDSLNHRPGRIACGVGFQELPGAAKEERAGRLLRPPPHNSQRKCVASQIASNGRPAIPDPPFSFPDEVDGTTYRGQSLSTTHIPQWSCGDRHGTWGRREKDGSRRTGLSPSAVWMPEVWGNLVSSGTAASNPRVGGAACTKGDGSIRHQRYIIP